MNWAIFSPGIVSSLKESLKRMGVDNVELYQVSTRLSNWVIWDLFYPDSFLCDLLYADSQQYDLLFV
jgi:hypothetical protein